MGKFLSVAFLTIGSLVSLLGHHTKNLKITFIASPVTVKMPCRLYVLVIDYSTHDAKYSNSLQLQQVSPCMSCLAAFTHCSGSRVRFNLDQVQVVCFFVVRTYAIEYNPTNRSSTQAAPAQFVLMLTSSSIIDVNFYF